MQACWLKILFGSSQDKVGFLAPVALAEKGGCPGTNEFAVDPPAKGRIALAQTALPLAAGSLS